jgi:VWFA-related protein
MTRHQRRGSVVVLTALLLAASLGARAQTPFRAGVEIVDVDVSVLDELRLPVTGLTAADFTVLEDGEPRPIVAFTPVELAPRAPPTAPWMAEVATDVQGNDLQREGRLIVVLFDRAIAFEHIPVARAVAEATVEQMRPADLAAIAYTEYGVPQNFTADRRRLLDAIRQPSANLPAGDSGAASLCFCGTCTLDRINDIAEALRDVRQRRKILIVIGSDIRVTGRGGCGAAVGGSRGRAMRAIDAANLTVYTFDPSGVTTLMANASARRPSSRGGLANLQRVGNLRILPDHTGGRAVTGNDPQQSLPEVFRESNSYYVLGFAPAHGDGRFHDIAVKVNRPGVTLQARRGYVASGGRPPRSREAPEGVRSELFRALSGLWPVSELPLTLTATPIAAAGLRAATVLLSLGIDSRGQSPTTEPRLVNVLVGAFDRNGRALTHEQRTIPATPRRPGEPAGHELTAELELGPGRYEIRAAIEDASLGATGSVYTYVDVPNYLTEFLSLSGLFLFMPPAGPDTPTLRREFTNDDRVSAWIQIYQGIRRAAMDGYFTAELRDERDTRVFHRETRVLVGEAGDNRAITERFDLPMDALSPGEYLLRVQMRQGNLSASRELRLRVR